MLICSCEVGGYCVVHDRITDGSSLKIVQKEAGRTSLALAERDRIVWNEAIEAAAKVARDNRADVPCTNEIRKLKK